MTSRERAARALNHQETDRAPVDFGGTVVTCPEYHAHKKLRERFRIADADDPIIDYSMGTVAACEELCRLFGSDFRRVALNVIPPRIVNNMFESGFGIVHKRAEPHLYYDVVFHPLAEADIVDLDRMKMPDPDDPALYHGLRDRAKDLFVNSAYAIVADFGVPGFYETSQKLRGYENLACDLLVNTEFVIALYDRLLALQKRYFKNYLAQVAPYAQIICYADDLGMQDRLQMSPETYRTLIKPYHKQIFDYIHSLADIKILMHCCGAISDVIDDLIEVGADILNPVQVRAAGMDPEQLGQRYGGKIAFWGGVDEQQLLPFGTPEQVEAETRRLLAALGKNGGYVLAPGHCIQPDTPPDNVAAIYRAAGGTIFLTENTEAMEEAQRKKSKIYKDCFHRNVCATRPRRPFASRRWNPGL